MTCYHRIRSLFFFFKQFESVIEENSRGVVHHMEVFHCEAGADNQIPLYRGPCFSEKRPYKTQVCKKVLAAWAMGADPFVYPEVSMTDI